MKRFKEFINEENAMNFLKPKSDEQIEKSLKSLDPFDRINAIKINKLGYEFMPSEEEISKEIYKLDNNERIDRIIFYKLDWKYLPTDKDGRCVYNGDLDFSNLVDQKRYPDNLTVNGNLSFYNLHLTELPKGLIVNGDLNCSLNNLTKLPDDLIVNGDLKCRENNYNLESEPFKPVYTKLELPEGATVKGKFIN